MWSSSTTASSICCTSAPRQSRRLADSPSSTGYQSICSVYVHVSVAWRGSSRLNQASSQLLPLVQGSDDAAESRRLGSTVCAQLLATPTGLPVVSARRLHAPRKATRSVHSLHGSGALCVSAGKVVVMCVRREATAVRLLYDGHRTGTACWAFEAQQAEPQMMIDHRAGAAFWEMGREDSE